MLFSPSCSKTSAAKNSVNNGNLPNLHRGMTLIQLMVTIAIASVLSSIAIPSLNDLIVELRVDNEISRLSRLLLVARNHSIAHQRNVIICPLGSNGSCTNNWHEELSVFVDTNGNQEFDGNINELMVTTKRAAAFGDKLTYAQNRTKITYQSTGHLFGLSNGTLKYCPKNYQDKSRGLVIARSGRFYATADNNHDGIDETRSKQIISCD